MNTRIALASILASIALADNITTVLAIEKGAIELNPLVAVFLQNIVLYSVFTAVKVFLCFYIVYRTFSKSKIWIMTYISILILFTRATIINMLNALQP